MIAVLDLGIGNRRSVEKAFERVGADARLTADHEDLGAADGLVVMGVGAFAAAMAAMRERDVVDLVRGRAAAGVPVLGLCLGMQLLFERSEELGGDEGLGLLAGEVRRLDVAPLKVPHIGWNQVSFTRASPLLAGLPAEGEAFYHVHSLTARPADERDVLGWGDYGGRFASVVERGNVMGCQFHPEKSSRAGLALLRGFADLCAGVPA